MSPHVVENLAIGRRQCRRHPALTRSRRRKGRGWTRRVRRGCLGSNGGRISVSANGAPCGKTTATTVMRGTTSLTIKLDRAPIIGARMALPGSVTPTSGCVLLSLWWNGRDPILKERLFGLTNSEGNHGEDVKEYYFYLDSTPTHSYMKYLYKYPQNAYPYGDLIETSRRRGRNDWEYELLDTGIFNENRYFDVFVEYAKAGPTDILIQISIANRGPEPASIHALPMLWFRNTWTWWPDQPKPSLRQKPGENVVTIETSHVELGGFLLHCDGNPRLLFTENDTNNERIFGTPNAMPSVKDGINNCVVAGRQDAVNPAKTGTKAAAHYQLKIGRGETAVVRLRLSNAAF